MRIGVTGATGLLGSELIKLGCVPIVSNLLNYKSLNRELNFLNLDTIIHCAGKTDVDQCELDIESAFTNNTVATANLVELFSKPIIFLSTDFVFSGENGPYTEKNAPSPVNIYGMTKLAAEMLVLKRSNNLVIRTTNLFGTTKDNFVLSVMRRLKNKEKIKLPVNVVGNPTYTPHLAEALNIIAYSPDVYPRIINLASDKVISRFDLGLKVSEAFGLDDSLISEFNYEGYTQRPNKAGLDVTLAKSLGLPIYNYEQALQQLKGILDANK